MSATRMTYPIQYPRQTTISDRTTTTQNQKKRHHVRDLHHVHDRKHETKICRPIRTCKTFWIRPTSPYQSRTYPTLSLRMPTL